MKKTKSTLAVIAAFAVALFCCGAFSNASLNIHEWTPESRTVVSVFWMIISCVVAIAKQD